MKKSIVLFTGVAILLLLALATPTFAAEDGKEKGKGKEVTITGEGKCGKCALKETEKCQNVVEVEKNGKKTKYYLVQNDISKAFHENLCKETKKVTVTGHVKNVEGKKELTATKIDLAKD